MLLLLCNTYVESMSQEKKEDKAADEVLSGEVEWEVYFNKVSKFLSKNDTIKCIPTNTLQKATSIHLLIAENSEFLRGNTSCGESESVEMYQMLIFPHRPASMSP